MGDSTFYTAGSTSTLVGNGANTLATPQSRTQLNREQITACNVIFVVAVLLYVFILIWCMDLSRFGFYFVVSINTFLLITDLWMWTTAQKWFPTSAKRRVLAAGPQ